MTITILGTMAGGIAGFAYYYYIGCISGTCPIQTNPWLSTLFGGLIGFLVFSEISKYVGGGKDNSGFISVNAESFKEFMNSNDAQIVDVRTESEFRQGHIPGAILANVTNGDLNKILGQLDKNRPVLVYCRSGNRSVTASKLMAKDGFTQIVNLKRGMLEWDGDIAK